MPNAPRIQLFSEIHPGVKAEPPKMLWGFTTKKGIEARPEALELGCLYCGYTWRVVTGG